MGFNHQNWTLPRRPESERSRMIISRTPYRISLFGGGTDFPHWYRRHGGAVIAAAINKYCYLSVRHFPPYFEHRNRIVWSKIEMCRDISEIEHPAVRAILQYLEIESGVEVHHVGDLPARSGIGSSSSFSVGLLNSLFALNGKMITKQELAYKAIHIEQEVMRENVGSQDQVTAAFGGLNKIVFHQSGEVSVIPFTIPKRRILELEQHLMLFYTGISRISSDIQRGFVETMDSNRRNLRVLSDITEEACEILNSESDIGEIGVLLSEAWETKKRLNCKVSNPAVEELYNRAITAGAISGKITGAGGGGFLLLFVRPEQQLFVKAALSEFVHVPFSFDFSGSQIVMASQELYSEDRLDFALRERHKPLIENVEITSVPTDAEQADIISHEETNLFGRKSGDSHQRD
jgi:D-glycero-alpha-D-manno-heptose-7-phosphate kinase